MESQRCEVNKEEQSPKWRVEVNQNPRYFAVFPEDSEKDRKAIGVLYFNISERVIKNKVVRWDFDDPFNSGPYSLSYAVSISGLRVNEDYQGRGIGTVLMDAVFEFASKSGYPLDIPVETKRSSVTGEVNDPTGFYQKYFHNRGINLSQYSSGGGMFGLRLYRIPNNVLTEAMSRSMQTEVDIPEEDSTTGYVPK